MDYNNDKTFASWMFKPRTSARSAQGRVCAAHRLPHNGREDAAPNAVHTLS